MPRLEELRLQAVEWRIEAALHLGHFSQVVPELHALRAQHPLREPFHCYLMTALYQCGRTADALAAFRHARHVLVNEIGIEPGPGLQLMHQRILAGDPKLAAASPARGPRAARARLALAPRQLPPSSQDFVGRTAELRQLSDLLSIWAADGSTVIGVISGPAGVGKTALAVHWAHRAADAFPAGQLYIDLNGFGPAGVPTTQAEAISRVLGALQVPTASIPASLHSQVGLYRSLLSDQRLLLVLDNAKDADQVRPLLPGGAGCLVLVTSRSPLTGLVALNSARPLLLRVFSDGEAHEMVARRLGHPRTESDRAATAQLINACARLPLALAIASALVAARPGQSLTRVASDLMHAARRLDSLSAGEETANLRSVFFWSYRSLSPDAARMFRLLAEHPGPDVSLTAAASLACLPTSRADDVLAELAGLHLMNMDSQARFSFHDLVRLYAAEMFHARETLAERRAAGRRMLDHYLHTAWVAAHAISPSRDRPLLVAPVPGTCVEDLAGEKQATAWLSAERRVLARVISYAAGAGADIHAWQLPWALADFLDRGGHWPDLAAGQQIALAAAQRLGDQAAQAHAHRYIGRASFQLQDLDHALDHLSSALELRHQLAEPAGVAAVSLDLSHVHEQRGDFDQALHYGQIALRLYRSHANRAGEAFALNAVGWCHALKESYPEALICCEQALELCAQLDRQIHQIARAYVHDSLGFIYQHTGRSAESVASYQQALDIFRGLDNRYFMAATLTRLGDAHHAAHDVPAAREALQEALIIYDDLHHPDRETIRQKLTFLTTPVPASGLADGADQASGP